jgi:hypothetical protein
MENEFLNLSTKFLFINGDSGMSERKTSELNRLLNDLSCLDYKYQNITDTKVVYMTIFCKSQQQLFIISASSSTVAIFL